MICQENLKLILKDKSRVSKLEWICWTKEDVEKSKTEQMSNLFIHANHK